MAGCAPHKVHRSAPQSLILPEGVGNRPVPMVGYESIPTSILATLHQQQNKSPQCSRQCPRLEPEAIATKLTPGTLGFSWIVDGLIGVYLGSEAGVQISPHVDLISGHTRPRLVTPGKLRPLTTGVLSLRALRRLRNRARLSPRRPQQATFVEGTLLSSPDSTVHLPRPVPQYHGAITKYSPSDVAQTDL